MCLTFRHLCKCDIIINLTDEHIHLPAIFISKVSIRSGLMYALGGGS